jgi:hypothetical protein
MCPEGIPRITAVIAPHDAACTGVVRFPDAALVDLGVRRLLYIPGVFASACADVQSPGIGAFCIRDKCSTRIT